MMNFDKMGMATVKPDEGNPLEGIDFSVVDRQLSYAWGDQVRGTPSRAIVREDNGKLLGIVGDDYVVHDHRPGILHAVETLRELGDGRVNLKHTVNKFGGRIFTDVFLPTKGIGKGPEAVTPKFRFTSTYDGSRAVTVTMGLFRLVCSNGMGQWLESETFRRRHSATITAEDLSRALETVPVVYDKYQTLLRSLSALPIPTVEEFGAGLGARNASDIWEHHLAPEVSTTGPTAWSAFQAATRWATRSPVSEDHRASMFNRVEAFFLPLAGIPI